MRDKNNIENYILLCVETTNEYQFKDTTIRMTISHRWIGLPFPLCWLLMFLCEANPNDREYLTNYDCNIYCEGIYVYLFDQTIPFSYGWWNDDYLFE